MVYDAIIIGAGASGLSAAIGASERNRKVLVIDHASEAGKKIRISGGGKCNVTNRHISTSDYFGADSDFCKYALKHFSSRSALRMLTEMGIQTEEREYGRIFCKNSAGELVAQLVQKAENAGVRFAFNTTVKQVRTQKGAYGGAHFSVTCGDNLYESASLLIATGGLAWPQIGATDFGYILATQFGHQIIPLRPALTGFLLSPDSPLMNLQGISLEIQLQVKEKSKVIAEPLLFTHKGISGPAALQASCFWEKGDVITINFLPSQNIIEQMHAPSNGKLYVQHLIAQFLPDRLSKAIIPEHLSFRKVAELSKKERQSIAACVHAHPVLPDAVEDFSKAEVTSGGVSTAELNPKTMESLLQKGLFFSGEVIDITGKLGGYNIHWAFASGRLAGQYV